MTPTVTPTYTTHDDQNDESVFYFVEDGPWPTNEVDWNTYLKGLQDRILSMVDAAVDGGVAQVYPASVGTGARIQIDSPSGEPERVRDLVFLIREFLKEDPAYREAIASSRFVRWVRVVTGHELGRFQK